MPLPEETILPFPGPAESLGLATEVRSTLIASSLASLRARGVMDRYTKLVSPVYRDTLLGLVAAQWHPMELGFAHYNACEALGFTVDEQIAIGSEVSHKIHDTFVGVIVKTAKQAGVTPWVLFPKGNQILQRLFRGGGGTRVTKLGPKEARAELVGIPIFEVPYFRNAVLGIYQAACSLFCTRCYVHEMTKRGSPTSSTTLRISWV